MGALPQKPYVRSGESAVSPPRASGRSPKRESGACCSPEGKPEHRDYDRGHQPPRIDSGGNEGGGYAEGDHNARCRPPVVADHEVPPEQTERAHASHANATLRRLRVTTAPNESSTTN